MRAFRAAFSGRGIVAAVLALILLMQVQATMACALTDSSNPVDCPCHAPEPVSSDGCTDTMSPPEAAGCCAFGISVVPKATSADDPASSGPLLSFEFPKAPPPALVIRIAGLPPISENIPARFVVPGGTGIYLRTARLRL